MADPQRHRYRLADEPVSVVLWSRRSPDLQVHGLRAAAARRVYIPGDDVAVFDDSLSRIDKKDGAFDSVLVLPPYGFVSDIAHRHHVYTRRSPVRSRAPA